MLRLKSRFRISLADDRTGKTLLMELMTTLPWLTALPARRTCRAGDCPYSLQIQAVAARPTRESLQRPAPQRPETAQIHRGIVEASEEPLGSRVLVRNCSSRQSLPNSDHLFNLNGYGLGGAFRFRSPQRQ